LGSVSRKPDNKILGETTRRIEVLITELKLKIENLEKRIIILEE